MLPKKSTSGQGNRALMELFVKMRRERPAEVNDDKATKKNALGRLGKRQRPMFDNQTVKAPPKKVRSDSRDEYAPKKDVLTEERADLMTRRRMA